MIAMTTSNSTSVNARRRMVWTLRGLNCQGRILAAQDGVTDGVVRWALATQEAGKCDDFVNDGQIGVEMNVFFEKLGQFALAAGELALDAADRQVGMKAARLFGEAELEFEGVVESGLQLFQLVGAILDADPKGARLAGIGKCASAAAGDLKGLEAGGDFVDDTADIGRFGIGHVAQEFEREVHLLWADPIDLRSSHAELVYKIAGTADDAGREFDGDEGA